jgi:hypothetical protein
MVVGNMGHGKSQNLPASQVRFGRTGAFQGHGFFRPSLAVQRSIAHNQNLLGGRVAREGSYSEIYALPLSKHIKKNIQPL